MSDCGCGKKVSSGHVPFHVPSWLRMNQSTIHQEINKTDIMRKHEVINRIIKEKGYTSYLEIGVDNPDNCFNLIECEKKTGIDPYSTVEMPSEWNLETVEAYKANVQGELIIKTSDEYFEKLGKRKKYDFIFIDGLHLAEQVTKDIENSLKHLTKGGFIMLHDCLPNNENETTKTPKKNDGWMGTSWEAFAQLRLERDDLTLMTINTDCGLGCIIPQGKNEKWLDTTYPKPEWSWEYYTTHKHGLMNVVSVSQFLAL